MMRQKSEYSHSDEIWSTQWKFAAQLWSILLVQGVSLLTSKDMLCQQHLNIFPAIQQ